MCGVALVVRAMEIKAGLRWDDGSERIRERSARPRLKAVVLVNVWKSALGEDSCAASVAGFDLLVLWLVGERGKVGFDDVHPQQLHREDGLPFCGFLLGFFEAIEEGEKEKGVGKLGRANCPAGRLDLFWSRE